jgi:hypothetical protein
MADHLRAPLILVFGTAVLLAACDSDQKGVVGPGATPQPTAPVQVVLNGCKQVKGLEKGDITFMKSQIVRQQTDLQRVDDDITGAVPGGDLTGDTKLAESEAKLLADRINSSTLCAKVRGALLNKANALANADTALVVAVGSSGDVAGALKASQAAFQDLKSAVDAIN